MSDSAAQSTHEDGPRLMPFQPPQGDLAILAGSANPKLARDIARQLGVSVVPSHAQYFSEGNVFVRVLENVRGRDVFVIQGINHPVNDNFMELLFWIVRLQASFRLETMTRGCSSMKMVTTERTIARAMLKKAQPSRLMRTK